jgi:hypothetical protein
MLASIRQRDLNLLYRIEDPLILSMNYWQLMMQLSSLTNKVVAVAS